MRNTWSKPKLIVLVKGTSDERVLMGCKGAYSETPSEEYTESTDAPGNPCQLNARFCVACQSTSM